MTDLRSFMEPLARRLELSADQATAAFEVIMSGAATPSQVGATSSLNGRAPVSARLSRWTASP